jgi:hypothetical protein
MKKVALAVAVLAFGLAACEPKADTVNNAANETAVENNAETDLNAATNDAIANADVTANADVALNATDNTAVAVDANTTNAQ